MPRFIGCEKIRDRADHLRILLLIRGVAHWEINNLVNCSEINNQDGMPLVWPIEVCPLVGVAIMGVVVMWKYQTHFNVWGGEGEGLGLLVSMNTHGAFPPSACFSRF